jgi:hypothetical protein
MTRDRDVPPKGCGAGCAPPQPPPPPLLENFQFFPANALYLTQSNSGQEFRESYRDGIAGNCAKFLPNPEFMTAIGSSLDAEFMIE